MKYFRLISIIFGILFLINCATIPTLPSTATSTLDSLRISRCPRLMSSAAEYYRNKNWQMTVKIYNEIITLGCNDWNSVYAPLTEIYQFYAIAYEQMGKFDSAAYVLLDGLDKSPNDDVLIKRLEYSRRSMNQLKQNREQEYVRSNSNVKKYPKPKYPADLALKINFIEPSGNEALDANEKATIELIIANNGMGEAYDVKPQITLKSSTSYLSIGKFQEIDKLPPSSTFKRQTMVSAGRDISSQEIELEIKVTEYNGFDLYPSGLLKIQTRALSPPKLILADVGIDDLNNSNGRIEPNEIIEATAIIHNIGQGVAENVNVDVSYGSNIFKAGDSKTSFSIGTMQPNETRQVVFQFFATRKAQEDLPISLNITEQNQQYGSNQTAGLSLNKEFKRSTEVIIAAKENKLVEITSIDGISVDIEKNIPKTGMKNRDAIAVVIGNKEYTSDVPNVDFAVRDAQFVKEYLIKTMGYREGNIFYYANATKAQIGVAFKKLKNAVKPNKSDVFVYYSGHGAPDPESNQGYFVPVDANPNYINKTGYSVDELYALLSKIKAKNTLVVIDACFSGSSDQGMILKDISPVFIEVDDSFLNSKNSAVFTSATGKQVSSWYRDKSHSLFTYYFLKGLQGEADLDSDGTLILSEIKDYIDDHVPYMARRINNRKQDPQLMTDDDTKVLVTY